MSVLALDISGTPRQWISYDNAILYHATKSVAWTMGEVVAKYRGGIQRNGKLSYIETQSIIAIKGHGFNPTKHSKVALGNRTLFGRDKYFSIVISITSSLSNDDSNTCNSASSLKSL